MTSLLDPTTTSPRPTQRQETLARLLIAVFAAAALASVVVLIAKTGRRGGGSVLEQIFGTLNIPLASTPISVLVLWIMWGALSRRKRVALVAVGVFQLLGAAVSAAAIIRLQSNGFQTPAGQGRGYILAGQSALAVAIGLASPVLLYRIRNAFPAKVRSNEWWKAISLTFAGVLLSLVVSAVLLTVANIRDITDEEVFRASLLRALGFPIPRFPHEAEHTIFLISQLTSALIVLSICGGLYLLLRPSRRDAEEDESVEERLRTQLLEMPSPDSLSYFSTRRDKRVFTSSDGQASLAYRLIGPVCLVSADPVGDRASWPLLAAEWKSACRTYGWVPAVIGASEEGARLYLDQGLSVITLGDEAILHPDRFTLDNEAMTPVRQAVQRARRSGLSVGIHRMRDLDEEQRASLAATVFNWRTDRERGFSMALGRFNDPADADTVVVVAHNDDGEPHGLLSFVPWGRAGLSLDLMLRSPSAPNGTTELMVAELMAACRGRGIARVSLNFAVFRSIFADADRLGASLSTRINSGVLGFLDRFTQVESLYRANDKFKPDWQPRFFLFDGVFTLPRVALAAGSAEGFLPEPAWLRARVRRPLSGEALGRLSAKARALRSPDVDSLIHKPSSHTCLRLDQARRLAEGGMEPFPLGAQDALPLSALTAEQWRPGAWLSLFGRAEHIRKHGGVLFIDLREGSARLQIIAEQSVTEQFELLRRGVGTGDLLLVRGEPGVSRSGTPSLLVASWTVAAKALHPVPFRGLTDPETRLRRRSTDLLTNPAQVERLRLRSRAVHALREVLVSEGFTEVETPMLNTVHGGASARPFRTFSNAYGVDLTLRIAPELQLKRLLVGGLGPVFEIGRNFRNEGADATHNPEFTALEAYQPFGDYVTMRHLAEKLVKRAAHQAHASVSLPLRSLRGDDDAASEALSLTDVSGPWPVVPVIDAVSRAVGQPVDLDTDIEVLLDLCRRHGVDFRPEMGPGALIEELYGELVEPVTVFPTFYVDFPVETSPLAGAHRTKPGLAERWDLVANGMELGTAYSELTDPVEQRRRLTEQSLKAAHGDPEAMAVDEDFLYALETGMPPAGGLGLGVDRLIMLLTGSTIRDVITFPFVRPLPRR